MIIDILIDLQNAMDTDTTRYQELLKENINYLKEQNWIPCIRDAFKTGDNNEIRKALRKYIIWNDYSRRYFKVIRMTDWTI